MDGKYDETDKTTRIGWLGLKAKGKTSESRPRRPKGSRWSVRSRCCSNWDYRYTAFAWFFNKATKAMDRWWRSVGGFKVEFVVKSFQKSWLFP